MASWAQDVVVLCELRAVYALPCSAIPGQTIVAAVPFQSEQGNRPQEVRTAMAPR